MKRTFKLVPLLMLAVVLAFGLFVAGCGGSEEPTDTTAAPTDTTAAPTETTAAPTDTTEAGEPSGETIILRLPMGQPEGDPLVVPLQDMAARFNEAAAGAYEIQIFTASSLISPAEALDAVRTGSVELGSICYPIYAAVDERLSIIELPFIFDSIKALELAHNDDMVSLYDELTSGQFNQKTLGMNHVGFNELIGTKPLTNLDEWSGQLVGVASPIGIDMMQQLGAQTVVIDWTESYSNLEKGVVDQIVAGTQYMWIAELYKPGKYSTWMSGTAPHYGVTVNLDVWNAMPPDIQELLATEVKAACEQMNVDHTGYLESNKKILTDNGTQVFIPDETERNKWKAETEDYLADKIAEFGDFGARFMAIVDAANAAAAGQ
jgi:TRAP-type C4-dicarboxylate transport system substrate-binding protein